MAKKLIDRLFNVISSELFFTRAVPCWHSIIVGVTIALCGMFDLPSFLHQAVFHIDQALRYALGGLELRINKAEYLTYLGRLSDAEDIVK